MNYELPNPSDEKQWLRCLILSYKVTKGVEFDDRNWDKVNWGRCTKSAKIVLSVCGGLRQADACIVDLAKEFEEKSLGWTLETVARYSYEWVQKKHGGVNGNSARKRLFDAIAQSRANQGTQGVGAFSAPGEIFSGVRNMPQVQLEAGTGERSQGNGDGSMLQGILEGQED